MNKVYFDCTDGIRKFHITHVTYSPEYLINNKTGRRSKGGLIVRGYMNSNDDKNKTVRFYYSNYNKKFARISVTAIMNHIDARQNNRMQSYINQMRAYKSGLEDEKPNYPYWLRPVDADCDYTQEVEVTHYGDFIQINFNEYQFNKKTKEIEQ